MAEPMAGDPAPAGRFVRLNDGDMHVVEDGKPGAPAVLLIHGTAGSTAWWDPVVARLAGDHRVIRVDLLGHGRSASPAGGYDIPTQAGRVGEAMDKLGVDKVVVVGHSTGGFVAAALTERRRDLVAALALIDTGPSMDAYIPRGLLDRLLRVQLPGRVLYSLRTDSLIRKAMRSAFTRPVDIPDAFIKSARGMTYRALAETSGAPLTYLRQRSIPDRLAALGVPLLVIFGTDDKRWRSAAADGYRAVPGARVELLPGVGHTPMLEDPQATGTLLLAFAAAAGHPS